MTILNYLLMCSICIAFINANSDYCENAVGPCLEDGWCPEGLECIDNQCCASQLPPPYPCENPVGPCLEDGSCPEGLECIDNQCCAAKSPLPSSCENPVGPCLEDSSCPGGFDCVDNQCCADLPLPTVIPCPNNVANDGPCEKGRCNTGYRCINHFCCPMKNKRDNMS